MSAGTDANRWPESDHAVKRIELDGDESGAWWSVDVETGREEAFFLAPGIFVVALVSLVRATSGGNGKSVKSGRGLTRQSWRH